MTSTDRRFQLLTALSLATNSRPSETYLYEKQKVAFNLTTFTAFAVKQFNSDGSARTVLLEFEWEMVDRVHFTEKGG